MAIANALQLDVAWATPALCHFNYDAMPFAVYRLWREEILYQIWTQLSNPRQSYCEFNIWPNNLESRVTCWARLWDNFHQVWPSTTHPSMNYSVFMLIHYVTLWPWPLTRWPWKFVVHQASNVRNLSEIEQSPAELLIILRIFTHVMLRRNLKSWPLNLWTFTALRVSCV